MDKLPGVLLRACVFGVLASTCACRPLAAKATASLSLTTDITAQSTELTLPVVATGQEAEKGPCTADTPGLIPLRFTVTVCADPAAPLMALDTVFLSNSSQQPAIKPCLVVKQQQQLQQAQEQQPPKERMQVSLGSSKFSYTAYFRAMSRDLCGTLPKVVIAATVQQAVAQQQQTQQPILNTTEVNVIPWGCAFLVGDAEAAAPAVPAGMPQPQMQAAAADAPAPALSPVLM